MMRYLELGRGVVEAVVVADTVANACAASFVGGSTVCRMVLMPWVAAGTRLVGGAIVWRTVLGLWVAAETRSVGRKTVWIAAVGIGKSVICIIDTPVDVVEGEVAASPAEAELVEEEGRGKWGMTPEGVERSLSMGEAMATLKSASRVAVVFILVFD
jgi:hypothetical protein